MQSFLEFLVSRKNVLLFLIARGISVAIKPLLLWYFIKQGRIDFANLISLYFLCHGSLMIIFNNEAHFSYYKKYYNSDSCKYSILREEVIYYENFIYHFIFFSSLVLVLTLVISTPILFVPFFVLIVFEKIVDEVQRFLLFNKSFKKWSFLMLSKGIFPTLLVVLMNEQELNDVKLFYVFFASFALFFLCYAFFFFSKTQFKLLWRIVSSVTVKKLFQYLDKYRKKLVFNQLQSFLSRNVPLTDRLIVRLAATPLLAEISLIAQIGSIPILIVDFFLISTRRKEYLDINNDIEKIVSSKKVSMFFVLSYLVFFLSVYPLMYFGIIEFSTIHKNLILLIGVYFAVFSISQHYVNFNFWRVKRLFTLSIEILYYVSVSILFLIFNQNWELIESLIASLIIGHIIRGVLLVTLSFSKHLHVTV